MKGLLVKDFQILRNQGRVVFMLTAIFLFLGFTSEESSFAVSYCTFCLSALVTTTVSYDDLDNGYSFLFTLPITRKMYVLEKYLLAFIICVLTAGASSVAGIVIASIKGEGVSAFDSLMLAAIVAMMCLVMVSIMLPIQMKFGAEKSRIIMFGLVGGVLVIGCVLGFLADKLQKVISIDGERLLNFFESLSDGTVIAILLLLVIVVIGVTMGISIRVMEKKEM